MLGFIQQTGSFPFHVGNIKVKLINLGSKWYIQSYVFQQKNAPEKPVIWSLTQSTKSCTEETKR
jgi:hypothetical protein